MSSQWIHVEGISLKLIKNYSRSRNRYIYRIKYQKLLAKSLKLRSIIKS